MEPILLRGTTLLRMISWLHAHVPDDRGLRAHTFFLHFMILCILSLTHSEPPNSIVHTIESADDGL